MLAPSNNLKIELLPILSFFDALLCNKITAYGGVWHTSVIHIYRKKLLGCPEIDPVVENELRATHLQTRMKMLLEQHRQTIFQLLLSDQRFNYLLRCDLIRGLTVSMVPQILNGIIMIEHIRFAAQQCQAFVTHLMIWPMAPIVVSLWLIRISEIYSQISIEDTVRLYLPYTHDRY